MMKAKSTVAIAALAVLTACATAPPPKPDESAARARAETYIRGQLFDDEAARFKDWTPLFYGTAIVAPERYVTGWSICVRVNGKNRYGGYVGYQAYRVMFEDNEPKQLINNERACADAFGGA
jgi:hypothetical protein